MKTTLKGFVLLIFILMVNEPVSAEQWKRVYLATYPRAGNHWMRHLIEDASGIATSSVYIDQDAAEAEHLKIPFPWGGYAAPNGYSGKCRYPTSKDYVVVKTHYPAFSNVEFDLQPASKIIRIIRHPVDSFCSFRILRDGSATSSRISRDFLLQLIHTWRSFQEYWDNQKNVLTIRYEDLFEQPSAVLAKILAALRYDVKDEDIRRAVEKNPPKGKLYKHLEGFNEEDLALVEEKLGDLMLKYHYKVKI